MGRHGANEAGAFIGTEQAGSWGQRKGEKLSFWVFWEPLRVRCLSQNGYDGPRFIFEKTYLENELKTQSGRIESIGPYCSTDGWDCGRDIGEGTRWKERAIRMEVSIAGSGAELSDWDTQVSRQKEVASEKEECDVETRVTLGTCLGWRALGDLSRLFV